MFRLCQKLKILKKPLRKLLFGQGSYAGKVQKCREDLDRVQTDLDKDPNNGDLRSEEGLYMQAFLNACKEEEMVLKQRAKVQWLKERDSNSAYFHKVVRGKINKNRVETILGNDGNWKEGDEAYKQIVNYFSGYLGVDSEVCPINNPEDLFENKLNQEQALDIVKEITCEEIKAAVFDIDDDKAPGPDGYSSKFFKAAWVIVGEDFCKAVKEFFCKKKILKEINATAIALVPKVQTPGRVGDYRPIACCNVVYKCISKIIVKRIRDYLKFLVSDNQSAFIPGRSILDNVLLSQELVKGYHIDRGYARCALKVDIQKAYDSVNWKDCKNLVERVKLKVNNWKNKTLSYAGRFQLISSVLASLPVYWASVVLIPKSIIKDIEKIMRNFLWNSGESRKGIAKVAWNEICRPKIYGGLGLKNLSDWNIALLSSRIWKILSGHNSLRVRWINSHLLEGRSFWDVDYKDKMSWSWRNLLKIRPYLRDSFYVQIGSGDGTFMWYDNWHQLGPLSYVLSPREIANAGYNIRDKVSDVIINEDWSWPDEWIRLIPQLGDAHVASLIRGKKDVMFWLNCKNELVPFAVNQVSASLTCRESPIGWHNLVWFQNRISSHSFILWLAIREGEI
uniref:Reverse transcriptase domain-containing protein n=1 Tax=Lactuca sativa TaxID=4236 RepID=A0A9R1VWG5_LACSA|nr:hypothetical protein LSAT_V11C400156830 [Lactuca sativa]